MPRLGVQLVKNRAVVELGRLAEMGRCPIALFNVQDSLVGLGSCQCNFTHSRLIKQLSFYLRGKRYYKISPY